MAQIARPMADPRVLAAVDAIRVVNLLSWRYRDPGLALGEPHPGARDPGTRYTGIGGNVPQTLVNQACLDIMAGRAEVVLLAGAETGAPVNSRRPTEFGQTGRAGRVGGGAARRRGRRRHVQPGAGPHQTGAASHVYPRCSRRGAAGGCQRGSRRPSPAHRGTVGAVQRGGPAQSRMHGNRAYSADEIGTAGLQEPDDQLAYTKLLNSNNMVDQGAALDPDLSGEGDLSADPFER